MRASTTYTPCSFCRPSASDYEKCEIILCTVDRSLKNTGITVMDGPFFSLMPFGRTGLHSLTSVTFTPHETSYDSVATFPCQQECGGVCKPGSLYNCNEFRPSRKAPGPT